VALLESLVLKITQSDDAPTSLKSPNLGVDYERNQSVDGSKGRDVDDMVMNSERNQRDGNRDRDRNSYDREVDIDHSDIDRKLSNISIDIDKDKDRDRINSNINSNNNRNSDGDSGKQLKRFSVLSVIAKVINKVSITGAALSEQEERIELARKSGIYICLYVCMYLCIYVRM
jgi:hypothetical protein